MIRDIRTSASATDGAIAPELAELLDRLGALPPDVREALSPAVEEAIEQARFRSRVLDVAREALERLRLELEMTRFDLELTRQERETLRLKAS